MSTRYGIVLLVRAPVQSRASTLYKRQSKCSGNISGVFCQRQRRVSLVLHERHYNYRHQMPYFSLKMHQIHFPRSRWGSLDLLAGFGEKEKRKRKVEREAKGRGRGSGQGR